MADGQWVFQRVLCVWQDVDVEGSGVCGDRSTRPSRREVGLAYRPQTKRLGRLIL